MCINRKFVSLAKFTDRGNDTQREGGVLIGNMVGPYNLRQS